MRIETLNFFGSPQHLVEAAFGNNSHSSGAIGNALFTAMVEMREKGEIAEADGSEKGRRRYQPKKKRRIKKIRVLKFDRKKEDEQQVEPEDTQKEQQPEPMLRFG